MAEDQNPPSNAEADGILGEDDLPIEKVLTPEWKSHPVTYIRTMGGIERDAYEVESYELGADGKDYTVNRKNVRARLLVRCISDEKGNRLFTDDQAEQLGKKSAKVLDRLFSVAQRLNGLSKQDVDELVKNSDAGQGAGS
jgi:hypothetical protein